MLASLLAVLSAGSKYSLETDPNAVCVDGSPAAYYYEPASTEASALTWIIYLQGGGMCYSESGCYSRCTNKPTRCSSTSWGDDEKGGLGILLADDPVLRHAHKVYLRYCTSDAHWGNVQQAEWTWNGVPMQFRGRRVVEAMLADLVATHGLGASPGTTLARRATLDARLLKEGAARGGAVRQCRAASRAQHEGWTAQALPTPWRSNLHARHDRLSIAASPHAGFRRFDVCEQPRRSGGPDRPDDTQEREGETDRHTDGCCLPHRSHILNTPPRALAPGL